MFSLLALGSAALYGAADFLGGLTSRRADTLVVVVISQLAGLILVALLLPVLGTPLPAWRDWMWGGLAGLAGGVGVALLYRALAVGVMSLVAPVTAVCAVIVPVVVAVGLLGERPAMRAAAGIAVALVAIALVSQSADLSSGGRSRTSRGLGLAFAAGIAVGVFLLALAQAGTDSGLWPLLFARIASVTLFGALALAAKRSWTMTRGLAGLTIAGGIVDMLANLLYLLATRQGPLTLVVTLSSLYPASTVLLARFVLHERLSGPQWAGVALAMAAIVMIVSA